MLLAVLVLVVLWGAVSTVVMLRSVATVLLLLLLWPALVLLVEVCGLVVCGSRPVVALGCCWRCWWWWCC